MAIRIFFLLKMAYYTIFTPLYCTLDVDKSHVSWRWPLTFICVRVTSSCSVTFVWLVSVSTCCPPPGCSRRGSPQSLSTVCQHGCWTELQPCSELCLLYIVLLQDSRREVVHIPLFPDSTHSDGHFLREPSLITRLQTASLLSEI